MRRPGPLTQAHFDTDFDAIQACFGPLRYALRLESDSLARQYAHCRQHQQQPKPKQPCARSDGHHDRHQRDQTENVSRLDSMVTQRVAILEQYRAKI